MTRYYIKCALLGIVAAVVATIIRDPVAGFSLLVGTAISIINLWAFSYIVKSALEGKGLALLPMVFLKLGGAFLAVGLAIYYLQLYVVYVVVGLSTLVVAIAWQAISDSLHRH